MINSDFTLVSFPLASNPAVIITWSISTNFSSANREKIALALEDILTSPTGKQLIVEPHFGGTQYTILQISNSGVNPSRTLMGLSDKAIAETETSFINKDGTLQFSSLERTIAHELSHYAIGTNDPQLVLGDEIDTLPEFIDFNKMPDIEALGGAIKFANGVIADLDGSNATVRTNYFGNVLGKSPSGEEYSQYILHLNLPNYIGADNIQRTKIGSLSQPDQGNEIRLGSNDSSTDLLIGINGSDLLVAGGGRDFLFGADGRDDLFAGDGSDVLVGGVENDKLYGGVGEDILYGEEDNDELSGGTKDNVLTQLELAGGTDEDTTFYDDEAQDRLEGGTGADKYFLHRAEHTFSIDASKAYAYFDFIEGWNHNRQERDGFSFNDTLARFETVDRIKDVDGDGEIHIQDQLGGSFHINGISRNFEHIAYQGVDFYADEDQRVSAFVKDGDLYLMTSYYDSEFGHGIPAYWSGYVATAIIEDFNSGDFNFTIPAGDQGTSGNDTPTLTPGGPGDGAYYHGLDGDDVIIGTVEGDALRGDAGNDQISGGDGDDDVSGGDGNDTVSGEDGNDFVSGGAGNDILSGGAGNDWIRGGAGRDTISGGAGDDTIYFDNADYFWTAGVPVDIGGTGTDTLIVETGSSFNTAGLSWYGFERFQGADGNDRVDGNDGTIDYWMDGGAGNDLLTGNAGNDTLLGGDGDDTLRGGAGQDEYSGGAGNDIIYYATGDLFWDSGTPKDIGGEGIDKLIIEAGSKFNTAGLSWYGFEQFEGAEKDDRVDGNDASVDYWLDGGGGNDSLKGHNGADTLIGGTGDDGLTGGAGSDTFVFRFAETGHDTISDFSAGAATDDIIEFSSSVFTSFAEVLAAATDDGVSSTITIDANTSVILSSVLVAELHQDDFNFV
ncbi:Ca2+-binding RTX toxin-like protein [Labrenzia sp. EL_126]|nr:Ca2+-binding RTX toxin-like protein [Labrenzia sp. EL_126]